MVLRALADGLEVAEAAEQMSNNNLELPPASVLREVLRKITERLASELANPTSVAPDWSGLEWRVARAVAAMHGVSPLLAVRLPWKGPPGWQSFLETQHTHVAARHRRIEQVLCWLDDSARESGVPIMPLKGVALHALGLYKVGERPMADIDLLVRPEDSPRVSQLLGTLGFDESFANWKHKVFEPKSHRAAARMGEHVDNYLKVELHETVAEILPLWKTDITRLIFPGDPHSGLNAYPSRAALMAHLLIHAASAMAYRTVRLLHLHDISLLAARMSESDWQEVISYRTPQGVGPWWAVPLLELLGRYYTNVVPRDVVDALASQCRWLLRRVLQRRSLSDVSLSYPWIDAFPGIEWSRSPAEALEYVVKRVRPNKEMIKLRRIAVDTQVAIGLGEWGRLSQAQRMLRWVVSRPARDDTMHAVRTVLAQPL